MGNLGGGEVLVILLVALIVLGPTKLPAAVRQVGRFMGEIRRISAGFQQELRDAAKPIQSTTATIKAADPRKVIKPTPARASQVKEARSTTTDDTANSQAGPATNTEDTETAASDDGKPGNPEAIPPADGAC